MASWISRIVGDGIGAVVDSVGKLADTFIQTDDERAQFRLALTQIDQLSRTQLVQAAQDALKSRERILLAELKQDDLFTRRARPMVVYAGLAFIALDYVIFPGIAAFTGTTFPAIVLPTEFWLGWSGIVTTWVLGRTFEKNGSNGKIVSAIVGEKSLLSEEDN